MLGSPGGIHTAHEHTRRTSRARAVHAARARVVHAGVRGAHAGAGAGVAGHLRRRARARLGAHRLRQDPRRLPVGARPLRRRAAAGEPQGAHAPAGLRLAAQGPRATTSSATSGRRCAASARDVTRRRAHRRHAAEGAGGHAAHAARHPHHHPRVAVPHAHLAGPSALQRHAVGHRRRDPRGGADQARLAPGASRWSGWWSRRAATCSASGSRPRSGRSRRSRATSSVRRECTIVDAGVRKPLDLRIHVPVESMVEPDVPIELDPAPGRARPRGAASGRPSTRSSCSLVREHRSTLVFVNNRRAAERIALRLNDLAAQEEEAQGAAGESPREIARAHHGSLAREERVVIEDQLKSGRRCRVWSPRRRWSWASTWAPWTS